MARVHLLRHGTGRERIAHRRENVDLLALEAMTRRRTIWFITDAGLPTFGDRPASDRQPPRYVVVEVSPSELTRRFDRSGYWLYRSLNPPAVDAMIDDIASSVC